MCGRFTLRTPQTALIEHFGLTGLGVHPRYNIAPSQPVCVIAGGESRQVREMRWGILSPSRRRLINARSETVARRQTFCDLFRAARCLVPADGFFEWRKEGRLWQPYFFELQSRLPFSLAGVFCRNQFVILTTPANEAVEPLSRRMPAILPREGYDLWLDPHTSPEQLQSLLAPFAGEAMDVFRVSRRVNDPNCNDPVCVRRTCPSRRCW